MRPRQYSSFGELDDGGIYLVTRSMEGAAQLEADVLRYMLSRDGTPEPPPEIADAIFDALAEEIYKTRKAQFSKRGIPVALRDLLSAERKKDAVKLAKDLKLSRADFLDLSNNAEQLGFQHQSVHKEYVPRELEISAEEAEAFHSRSPGNLDEKAMKYLQKLSAIFRQRKNCNAHFLTKDSEWHLFYFSYDDALEHGPGERNHWSGGTHVHYVSHLWGYSKEEAWQQAQSRRTNLASVHVHFDSTSSENLGPQGDWEQGVIESWQRVIQRFEAGEFTRDLATGGLREPHSEL